jgi:putative membrane protein
MKHFMWLLKWVLKAAIFFTLFAFALNNQQDTTVYFFFGTQWRAPQVLVVLSAFAIGVGVGALGMVPRWWKQRRAASQLGSATGMHPESGTTLGAPVSPPHGL